MVKAIWTFFSEVDIGAAVCKTAENARLAFLARFNDYFASQESVRFLLSHCTGRTWRWRRGTALPLFCRSLTKSVSEKLLPERDCGSLWSVLS